MDAEEESAHKVKAGVENSPTPPAGIRAHHLSITSAVLYRRAIPALYLFVEYKQHEHPFIALA